MGWSGLQHRKHPANGEAAGGTVKPKGGREGAAQPVAAKRAEFSRRGIARQSGALPAIQGSVLLVADWSDAAGSFPTATLIGAAKSLPRPGPGQALSPSRSVPPRRGAPLGLCLNTLSYGAPNVKREFFEARQRLFEAMPRPTRGFATGPRTIRGWPNCRRAALQQAWWGAITCADGKVGASQMGAPLEPQDARRSK